MLPSPIKPIAAMPHSVLCGRPVPSRNGDEATPSPQSTATGSAPSRCFAQVSIFRQIGAHVLGKSQLLRAERREIAVDYCVVDLGEGGRLPMRLLVLVDHDGAHAFVKIMPGQDMLGQPIFEGERLFQRESA